MPGLLTAAVAVSGPARAPAKRVRREVFCQCPWRVTQTAIAAEREEGSAPPPAAAVGCFGLADNCFVNLSRSSRNCSRNCIPLVRSTNNRGGYLPQNRRNTKNSLGDSPMRAEGRRNRLTSEIQVGQENQRQHQGRCRHIPPIPTRTRDRALFLRLSREGQATDSLLRWRGGKITYCHHHHRRNDGNQHAEVLEIDVVANPQKRTGRIPGFESLQLHGHGSIHQHPKNAEGETHHHCSQCPLGVEALPKHTEEEHHKNGGRS